MTATLASKASWASRERGEPVELGYLYAGQGSQAPGMGKDLYEGCPQFRAVFDGAELDFDLKKACFEGEGLNETRYTQPCMVAFACGVTAILQDLGIRPSVAAGLSLGEYSALCAAGVWDAKTAISLAAFRGRAMEEAARGIDSAMIAVLQSDRETLQGCCDEASELGVVSIANYNCPGQLVLAGQREAVERAAQLAKQRGARRCLPLKTSGPFHTKLLEPASRALHEYFQGIEFQAPRFPVYFNCLGGPMGEGDTIAGLLERQVMSSVYMEDTIEKMAREVDAFIEIGPGKVLSGFVRKIAPEVKSYAVSTVEDVAALKEALGC